MKIVRILGVLAIVAATALLPSCQRSDKIQVGFVTNNAATFWTIAEKGARDGAREADVEVLFRRPDDPTPAKQKEIIDALLVQQVSAVAVSVIKPEGQVNYLNKVAQKVPLLCHDNDAPGVNRLVYLGTDNYAAGKELGKMVKEAMPDGGVIAIFVGQSEPLNAQQRRQGCLDELAGVKDARGPTLGKYRLHGLGSNLGPYTDDLDDNKAQGNARQALTDLKDEPNVCLVGLWAPNAPACYKAAAAMNKLGVVKIVGFDEDETTLLQIKAGHIYGTVVQQPYQFGYQTVKLMAKIARGDKSDIPADGIINIPHRRVTRENVDAFHAELKKLMGK
jgi:ribose transport system substrate-binding protein